jgi:hypothetical protein
MQYRSAFADYLDVLCVPIEKRLLTEKKLIRYHPFTKQPTFMQGGTLRPHQIEGVE